MKPVILLLKFFCGSLQVKTAGLNHNSEKKLYNIKSYIIKLNVYYNNEISVYQNLIVSGRVV